MGSQLPGDCRRAATLAAPLSPALHLRHPLPMPSRKRQPHPEEPPARGSIGLRPLANGARAPGGRIPADHPKHRDEAVLPHRQARPHPCHSAQPNVRGSSTSKTSRHHARRAHRAHRVAFRPSRASTLPARRRAPRPARHPASTRSASHAMLRRTEAPPSCDFLRAAPNVSRETSVRLVFGGGRMVR